MFFVCSLPVCLFFVMVLAVCLFVCLEFSIGEVIVVIRNAFKPDDFLHKNCVTFLTKDWGFFSILFRSVDSTHFSFLRKISQNHKIEKIKKKILFYLFYHPTLPFFFFPFL